MLKTIKIPVMFLILVLLVFMPKASFAWDQQARDHGDGERHRHDFHAHENHDLTLISGMEGIDSRVLIASGPDQSTDEIDQSESPETVITPVQNTGPDMAIFIVDVPNNKGGYTPVVLKKWGNAYLGPQGELYYPFPQVSQLKVMYGL